jgi:hypothetical protein
MSIKDTLRALSPGQEPSPWAKASFRGFGRPAVTGSEDLSRILEIPRRPPTDLDGPRGEALVELMSKRLSRGFVGSCACKAEGRPCITRLKPAQAWALYEAPLAGGILGPIGVGHGKSILDILSPLVFPDCKLAVLLIPPSLKEQLLREYLRLREHFKVPSLRIGNTGHVVKGAPVLHVIPYSQFSRAESTALLENLKPDLIIADEGHYLRHRQAARTSRVLRYLAKFPDTRLCVWSGTLTSKSVKDYAHLAAFALKESSPLPLDPNVLEEWSLALDPSDWPAPPGALEKLCDPGEPLHSAYHRRLVSTLGVTATRQSAVDASILICERKAPPIPETLQRMIKDLRAGWVRPDGEELVDILQVAKSARELASGLYLRWKFPRKEPESLIMDWFAARKAWNKELREKLKHRREHLDSPLLCQNAAMRHYNGYSGDLPTWESDAWPKWAEIKDSVYHETEAVWVDDFLADDAVAWGKKHRGVIWFDVSAFGKRVAEKGGFPLYAGGPEAGARLAREKGDRTLVMSIQAHGTGTDGLQRLFSEQLVANPPSSGQAWDQLLGRLLRIGQTADEVTTYVYRHTDEFKEAIDKALLEAKYIQDTLGTAHKLMNASFDWSV